MVPWPELIAWPLPLAMLAAAPMAAAAFFVRMLPRRAPRRGAASPDHASLRRARAALRDPSARHCRSAGSAAPAVGAFSSALVPGGHPCPGIPVAGVGALPCGERPSRHRASGHRRRRAGRTAAGCVLPWLLPSALLFAALDHGATAIYDRSAGGGGPRLPLGLACARRLCRLLCLRLRTTRRGRVCRGRGGRRSRCEISAPRVGRFFRVGSVSIGISCRRRRTGTDDAPPSAPSTFLFSGTRIARSRAAGDRACVS